MLFNSHVFLFAFLPVVIAGFLLLSRRNPALTFGWLTTCSLFFYGWWNPIYLWLLVVSIVVNFVLGRMIRATGSVTVLCLGIAVNLGCIAYYKYAGFFASIANALVAADFSVEKLLLPLGISFFTFQQITYLVECYRRTTVEHTFTEYALFVSFFPQLIAGPIVHESRILPQFKDRSRFRFSHANFAIGFTVFTFGLAKKVLIADRLAAYASPVFAAAGNGAALSIVEAWTGVLAFSLQLYFDFSGYSDMAVGLGLLFGIAIPINFFSPYKATSIIDFWRRWHITLSQFLRDYLYYPLGGNRRGPLRRYANVLIVMTLGGLWHGAGATFVFWGFLHGIFLVVNHAWRYLLSLVRLPDVPLARLLWRCVAWTVTFVCVTFGWVFFRAADWASAVHLLKAMLGHPGSLLLPASFPIDAWPFADAFRSAGWRVVDPSLLKYWLAPQQWAFLTLCMGIAFAMPNVTQMVRLPEGCVERTPFVGQTGNAAVLYWRPTRTWAAVLALVMAACVFEIGKYSEFLYFNF
jgi:D-alanyl-lipoteichoic acid acyltransferase DltB (MBOAT superfamily)